MGSMSWMKHWHRETPSDLKLSGDFIDDMHRLCSIFGIPNAILSSDLDDHITEDAEFEIIEPKQLPYDESTK